MNALDATRDAHTIEDIRVALQSIPMYDCPVCKWPYKSRLAAEACCEPDMGLD